MLVFGDQLALTLPVQVYPGAGGDVVVRRAHLHASMPRAVKQISPPFAALGHSATCCTPAERAAESLAALTWPPAGNVSKSASTKRAASGAPAFPGEAERLAVRECQGWLYQQRQLQR
eukprot:COSAG06_NODE_452_length_15547_cov_6.162416_11_plen_118_part_00